MEVSNKIRKRLLNIVTSLILYRPWRKKIREALRCILVNRTMKFTDLFYKCKSTPFNPQVKTILVSDEKIPTFDRDTGSRVIWQYLRFFRQNLGLNVYYMPLSSFPKGRYMQSLCDMGVNIVSGKCEQWLKKNGKKANYVFLCRPEIAEIFLPLLKKYTDAPIWYFAHDLHYIRERRYFEQTGNNKALYRAEKYKEAENRIINDTDAFLTVSSYEADIVKQTHPDKPNMVLPIYVWDEIPSVDYDAKKRKDIMFVGSSHAPNADALNWFLTSVFPKFFKQNPEVKFYIVGGNIPEDIKNKAYQNVIFTGFISDEKMNDLMNKVRLNVVPLRFGAGVKGKIIESVYQKLPVLTTPIGAEGIPDTPMISVAEPGNFAARLTELYNDTERLTRVTQTADAFLKTNYSAEVMEHVFNELKEIR